MNLQVTFTTETLQNFELELFPPKNITLYHYCLILLFKATFILKYVLTNRDIASLKLMESRDKKLAYQTQPFVSMKAIPNDDLYISTF
jgi:hypothetical protein